MGLEFFDFALAEEFGLLHRGPGAFFHGCNFVDEFADILKLAIDGGVAHIGDLIELAQLLHDEEPNAAGGQLLEVKCLKLCRDVFDALLDSLSTDRALFACLEHALKDFVSFEKFTALVALDHVEGVVFDLLVGGKSIAALQALAPPSNRAPIFGEARVDDFILYSATL